MVVAQHSFSWSNSSRGTLFTTGRKVSTKASYLIPNTQLPEAGRFDRHQAMYGFPIPERVRDCVFHALCITQRRNTGSLRISPAHTR
jgi:hypothetical protein